MLRDDPDDEIGPGLALDETAHLRKGKSAACVSPQHAGVTGRVENCVTWVFTALVTAFGQAWVDFDVYMPDCWAKDPRRRKKAGIPEGLAFATKPELALEQVRRLIAGGLRVLWAAADEVYGRSGDFRAGLRALGLSYVVIVPCDSVITFAKNKVTRADQAIHEAVFEQAVLRERGEGPPLRGLGAARHAGPGGAPADPPPAGPGQEPVHVLPVPRRRRPPRDPDLFPHHRRPQVASRNHFQNGKGRLRLGPVPGTHLGRPLPAHRPDRPRPAQGHRHPVLPVRRRRPPAGPGDRPGQPPRPGTSLQ